MMSLLLLLALAQADGLETRTYDVSGLVEDVDSVDRVHVGLTSVPLGLEGAAGRESPGLLGEKEAADLIRATVVPSAWKAPGVLLSLSKGTLTVTAAPPVHRELEALLAALAAKLGPFYHLEAAILSAEPAFLAEVRGAEGSPLLSEDQFRRLLEAARAGRRAALLKTGRIRAPSGRLAAFRDVTEEKYIEDYDRPIAGGALPLDPHTRCFYAGAALEVTASPDPFGPRVLLDVRGFHTTREAVEERTLSLQKDFWTAAPGARLEKSVLSEVKIQHPRLSSRGVRTFLALRGGQAAIAASVLHGDRAVVFLVGLRDERPAGKAESGAFGIYDLSALRPPPSVGPVRLSFLVGPGGLNPQRVAAESLLEPFLPANLIQERVEPESWGKTGFLYGSPSGVLAVRHDPAALPRIDRTLRSLFPPFGDPVTTEVALLGFHGPGAPDAPSLDADAFAKLLARARVLESAEITGLPGRDADVFRIREQTYVADFIVTPESSSLFVDPLVDLFRTGFVVRAAPRSGGRVAFSSAVAHGALRDLKAPVVGLGYVQMPGAWGMRGDGNLPPDGRWHLVGVESRGEGEALEEIALYARARAVK